MAALLVAMSVMSVMLAVAMPAWKQMAQREKETELIFRGQQYARAIGLFQRRAGPGTLPPNLDVLVQQRFLRKKYKDPITGDDFQLLLAGQAAPGSATPGATATPSRGGGPGAGPPTGGAFGQPGQAPRGPGGVAGGAGGIQGVVSKSTAKSIRIYNGRQAYNEWAFVYVPQVQAPNAPAGAPGAQGGRGPRGPGGIQPPPGPGNPNRPPGRGFPTGGPPSGGFPPPASPPTGGGPPSFPTPPRR